MCVCLRSVRVRVRVLARAGVHGSWAACACKRRVSHPYTVCKACLRMAGHGKLCVCVCLFVCARLCVIVCGCVCVCVRIAGGVRLCM